MRSRRILVALASAAVVLAGLACTSTHSSSSYGSTTDVYRNADSIHYDSFPWTSYNRQPVYVGRPSRGPRGR